MKRFILLLVAATVVASAAFAGSEAYSSKETKQTVAQPFCEWYANQEWNASLWGTYAFTGNEWEDDRYIEADHAWGGGLDIKYFFHRYFGVGVEGWAAEATRQRFDGFVFVPFFRELTSEHSRTVGAALGTFTLRYPFHCSRFSPYIWAGGGAMFGGGERDFIRGNIGVPEIRLATHSDSEIKPVGQFGGGLEFRITPHIGIMNDFSWSVVDGSDNNFGMVRTGINFAF